jgi:hypothetical protein
MEEIRQIEMSVGRWRVALRQGEWTIKTKDPIDLDRERPVEDGREKQRKV